MKQAESKKEQLVTAMERLQGVCAELEKSYQRLHAEVAVLRAGQEVRDRLIEELALRMPGGVLIAAPDGSVGHRNAPAAALVGGTLPAALGEALWRRITAALPFSGTEPLPDGRLVHISAFCPAPESGDELLVLLEPLPENIGVPSDDQQRRLAVIGEAAAQMAHEIRNPLGSMELFASMLEQHLQDEEARGMLGSIRRGLANIEGVVANYLNFSAPPLPRLAPLAVREMVDELFVFLKPVAAASGVILRDEAGEGLAVMADRRMIHQALLNLALNAIQAMPEGGAFTVSARPHGNGVSIAVADTGCGMNREEAAAAFRPFFTTREKGTGLGLSIVHNIVTAHGGTISLETAPGQGARFTLWLKGI